jgi:hypothetical protein
MSKEWKQSSPHLYLGVKSYFKEMKKIAIETEALARKTEYLKVKRVKKKRKKIIREIAGEMYKFDYDTATFIPLQEEIECNDPMDPCENTPDNFDDPQLLQQSEHSRS